MKRRERARLRQRGVTSVVFALVLVFVLGGIMALVVDVGHLWEVRSELQNAADSAALAGIRDLNGESARFPTAIGNARTYAETHDANGSPVDVPASDVVLGKWDFTNKTFSPLQSPAYAVNAVRVTTRRSATTGNAVATYFAPLIGVTQRDVTAEAIAVGGGPSSACGFVLTIPSCSVYDASGNLNCNGTLTFNSNSNNVAFTLLSLAAPNTPDIECSMACAVGYYPEAHSPSGNCSCPSSNCASTSVGNGIRVGNGNNFSNNMISYIQWAIDNSPNGLYVQLPVFEFASCPAGNLSNTRTVTGYVRLRITGATAAPEKSVSASIDCSHSSSSLPTQGFFGYKSTQVYLAK